VLPAQFALANGRLFDLLGPLLIIAVGLPMRLVNVGSHTGKGDEGIRAEQLLLMAHGFRPVKEIFASQGPLSLDVFYPFFALAGGSLAGARLAVVVYSILCVLVVFWIGRLVGGRVGGVVAAALLLLSPTFLKNSRLALVEVPALLPATVALGAALSYQANGRRRWIVVAAVASAVALAIKPMIAPVVPAVLLALLLRAPAHRSADKRSSEAWRRAVADLLLFGSIAAGLLAVIVLLIGPLELYDQVVRYRLGSRQAEGWSLRENWAMLWGELRWEGLPLFGLAALAGPVLLSAKPRAGIPLVGWALASFVMLLFYSPLGEKHAALMPPPLAALAGAGLGVAWGLMTDAHPTIRARAAFVACAAGLVFYVWSLPTVLERDRLAMSEGDVGAVPPYSEESALIQALTGPADYILVDDPYLAFLNDRLVPPKLVDTSIFRIRSGSLTGADVVAEAERFDVGLMLLLSDNLREIKKFRDWADESFVVVKINERPNRKDRSLYLRHGADFDGARAALSRIPPGRTAVGAEIGSQMRLASFALESRSVRAGGTTNLTVEWEATAPIAVDWHPITFLRDAHGTLVDETERSLGGGSAGTSAWQPGRWVYRTSSLAVPRGTPPGDYTLGIGLYDSKARRMALVSAGPGTGTTEVPLTTLQVR
jgi:hypothetical protein